MGLGQKPEGGTEGKACRLSPAQQMDPEPGEAFSVVAFPRGEWQEWGREEGEGATWDDRKAA